MSYKQLKWALKGWGYIILKHLYLNDYAELDSRISYCMFLHDYLLDCEISTVRTIDLMLTAHTYNNRHMHFTAIHMTFANHFKPMRPSLLTDCKFIAEITLISTEVRVTIYFGLQTSCLP